MANSKIEITFSAEAIEGDIISFERIDAGGTGTPVTIVETFVVTRVANYQVPLPTTYYTPVGLASASFYKSFFEIDYNGFSLYNVSIVSNVVTISSATSFWKYQNFSSTNAGITAIINNIVPSTFTLTSETVSANTNQCTYFDLGIVASENIYNIHLNGTITAVTPNTSITATIIRGVDYLVEISDVNDVVVEVGNYRYDFLATENITVGVTQYLTGATLTVNVTNTVGLTLEYSLDNVNWQTSNIFTGQTSGTKFLYVRDQFNCVKSKEYTVNDLGTRTAYSYISMANSISFSKVETWDGYNIFKNDENTLDEQGLQNYKYYTDIYFQTNDNTTIQVKSNYETVTAVLVDSSDVETSLTVTKKSSNLNRFKSLDALYYKYREGKLGVYFESGNTYDEAGTVLDTFALNGNLPEFAIIGQQVSIGTLGVFDIKDILYDEDINKRVIIVDYTYTGAVTSVIVQSVYDILNFEVYEFDIDWSLFSNGYYYVKVTHTDTINGTKIHKSERILLANEHLKTLAITYSNNNNRDIFYKYGIEHFIRIPYVRFTAKQQDESEINVTDNNAVVVESTVREQNEVLFNVLSNSLMRKLVIALSSENLFINGIGYVKDGSVSVEPIENTNLHEVTANLIKTNIIYSNFAQGQTGIDSGTAISDIPQIITTGTNFIKS